jgi:hypothetical protein
LLIIHILKGDEDKMKIESYFHDIAIGITGIQYVEADRTKTLSQSKHIKDVPKTDILDHIHSVVFPALKEIHKEYSWHYENEFISSECHVKIIEYKPFGDACILEIDGNRIKVNKKYLKELYSKKLIPVTT